MKKRILLVVTKSNFGGAQRYVFDLATHLPTDQFEVAVAFGPGPDGTPGRLARMLSEKGVRTVLVPELGRDVNFAGDWRAFRALITLLKKERPDVVHLNSSKAGGLGALAARWAKIPRIIFTSHGLAFDENRPFVQRILIRLATWATMMLAHTTIAISNNTFERARHLPFLWKRVALVHNGIETPTFFSPADARKELRSLDPETPDTLWIGSIGELHPNKNYGAMIDAMAHIDAATHLVLIGEGELRESLLARAKEKGVSGRVHLLGYVPEAAKYLRAFDAFVLPSIKEGLPYVLLEAGYAYVPVVASDIPGVRDVILDNFTGLLVPPMDSVALAASLGRVLGDATLARSLSDELLKRIQKSFPLETMVEKTASLYAAH
jgi:glycosyltransferase involved in cell wall biosynthesis